MIVSSIIIFFLVAALAFSWLYFLSFRHQSRKRQELAVKSFEDVKSDLRQEISTFNSMMEFMTHLHQLALVNQGEEKIGKVGKMVIDYACTMAGCPMGSVMVYDRAAKSFSLISVQGFKRGNGPVQLAAFGEEFARKAVESNEPITMENIKMDLPYRAMISFPLKMWGKSLGVLNIYSEEPHWILSEEKSRYLRALSQQCALALENISRSMETRKFIAEMIEPLLQVVEAKDGLQDDQKIRHYAREVAKEFRLPESIVFYVEFAALLRGIGKIWLDDLVLQKPGFLTSREQELVKLVPQYGHKMIKNMEFLSPVGPMILYHQEKWDGSGYPSGLKGEEIPLGSRIVGVVSAYHAMTTDRPYRKALKDQEAVRELQVLSGIQFDPKVVDAFVKIFEKEKGASREFDQNAFGGSRRGTFFSQSGNFWEWN